MSSYLLPCIRVKAFIALQKENRSDLALRLSLKKTNWKGHFSNSVQETQEKFNSWLNKVHSLVGEPDTDPANKSAKIERQNTMREWKQGRGTPVEWVQGEIFKEFVATLLLA